MSFLPWIGIVVIILTSVLLLRRVQTNMLLLFSGLLMIFIAVGFGVTDFLPKGAKSTGFIGFDVFELMRQISVKQISGIGLLIMTAGGFAGYMDKIGAARALVKVCTEPLKKLRSPYLVLMMAYLVGQFLISVIPSAAGLAMLLLVALFPILKGVGVSPAAAGAVIACSAGMTFAPTSGTANLAAKVADIDPIVYAVHYQWPVAVFALTAVAIAHYFVQKYFDSKGKETYLNTANLRSIDGENAPSWYAIFPILPIVLMIVFSKLVYTKVQLNTISALLLVWVFVVLLEIIRKRDVKKVFSDATEFFKKMGGMFASIVALIICAEMFAAGIKVTGVISLLIDSAQGFGFGMTGMVTVLSAIVGAVTFLTGSGVGAYSSFASLAPDIASALGGETIAFVVPMQFASGMIRSMSPVAGVILAVSGAIGLSPVALIRRTIIPMMIGMLVILTANWFMFIR